MTTPNLNRHQRRSMTRRFFGEATFDFNGNTITLRMDYYTIEKIESIFDMGIDAALNMFDTAEKASTNIQFIELLCADGEIDRAGLFDLVMSEDEGLLSALETVLSQAFPEDEELGKPKATPKKRAPARRKKTAQK